MVDLDEGDRCFAIYKSGNGLDYRTVDPWAMWLKGNAPAMIRELEAARAILSRDEIQWAAPAFRDAETGTKNECVLCLSYRRDGHDEDCPFALYAAAQALS